METENGCVLQLIVLVSTAAHHSPASWRALLLQPPWCGQQQLPGPCPTARNHNRRQSKLAVLQTTHAVPCSRQDRV